MYNYRNEAAFSHAVVNHLRKQGFFVQRIETGTIGRGVPDIYAVSPLGSPMWLELKRMHTTLRGKSSAKISWRPGQQAWLRQITAYKQTAYTLAAFDDCIAVIPHKKIWKDDVIIVDKCKILHSISAL